MHTRTQPEKKRRKRSVDSADVHINEYDKTVDLLEEIY